MKSISTNKRLVLGCGALVHELIALIKQSPAVERVVDLQCLPAKLHNTPQLIAGEVDKVLAARAHNYSDVYVAYADCGTGGQLDAVLEKYNARRMDGAHCYEFFAGAEAFNEIVEEELGSFFLTDYLVRNFERLVVKGLGLDRFPELYDEYFKHYKKMVYLAQTENTQLQELAKYHSDNFGLQYEYRFVGVQALSPVVESIFATEVVTDFKTGVTHVSA